MAEHRPEISNAIKKQLRTEAGQKCANPGCPSTRTHIHHIRQWATYRTHDQQHMIAVCPTCHDAIHHGAIKFDDATLYQWKNILRNTDTVRSHLYVEPGLEATVLLGSFGITHPSGISVFELSKMTHFKFLMKDGDILLIDVAMTGLDGKELFRVSGNHVKHIRQPDVTFSAVPGSIRIEIPATPRFLPAWAFEPMRKVEPQFAQSGQVTALALTAVRPGVARVEGIWLAPEAAIVATQDTFTIVRPNASTFTLAGDGETSRLVADLPIGAALFNFG